MTNEHLAELIAAFVPQLAEQAKTDLESYGLLRQLFAAAAHNATAPSAAQIRLYLLDHCRGCGVPHHRGWSYRDQWCNECRQTGREQAAPRWSLEDYPDPVERQKLREWLTRFEELRRAGQWRDAQDELERVYRRLNAHTTRNRELVLVLEPLVECFLQAGDTRYALGLLRQLKELYAITGAGCHRVAAVAERIARLEQGQP
jgi:hypothetical protein